MKHFALFTAPLKFRLLILCLLGFGGLSLHTQDRPNVLLITADDLGLQLSCYGETLIRTPHLDALAAGGTRFKVAYVAQASCSPSRSAMFTGLHTHGTGQYGLRTTQTGSASPTVVFA